LLQEAGSKVDTSKETMPDTTPRIQLTPETYLGATRMQFFHPGRIADSGTHQFKLPSDIPENNFSFGGTWTIGDEYAMAGEKATLALNFNAENVFLVMRSGSAKQNVHVKVYIDGKLVDSKDAGADVKNGEVTVDTDRLYHVLKVSGGVSNHLLKLEFLTPGTECYAFTFG